MALTECATLPRHMFPTRPDVVPTLRADRSASTCFRHVSDTPRHAFRGWRSRTRPAGSKPFSHTRCAPGVGDDRQGRARRECRWRCRLDAERASRGALAGRGTQSQCSCHESISALDSQRISTEAQLGRACLCVCGTTHVRPLALATLGSQLLANALPQLEPARAPPWRWSRRIAWTAGRPPTCFANVCASASVSKTLRRMVFWIARSVVTCSASTHSSSARRGDWPPLPEDPLAQQDPADLARAAS